jgi:hypothetical protein
VAEDGEQCSPIRITKRSRDSFAPTVKILEAVGSCIQFVARPVTFLIQASRELETPSVAGLFFSEPDDYPLRLLVYVAHHADLASLLLDVILFNTNRVGPEQSSRPAASQLP